MTKTFSAYEARTRFGEIINLAYYQGVEVIVERMGKPMIKIVKADSKKISKEELIKKYAGIWAGKDGEIIKKYANKMRKTAKFIKDS